MTDLGQDSGAHHDSGAWGSSNGRTRHDELLIALLHALAQGQPDRFAGPTPRETWHPAYAVWRLLHAWATQAETGLHESVGNAPPFGPDLLVLLRQVIRWHGMPLSIGALHPQVLTGITQHGDAVGVHLTAGHLEARPFVPTWLDAANTRETLDPLPRQRRLDEPIRAEPFLRDRLGFTTWNSSAQKEGVWRALTAPPRSTTLVALPTGAGKSLCFQALAMWATGLVVVVVPTVALAIDHWRSAVQLFPKEAQVSAMYFAADDRDYPADRVVEAVRSGQCRLLFTSPEACVSGRLRSVIGDAAQSGRLEALVIDEAHLADSWGMFFRVDFQVLAALRRQWLEAPGARLRTLLLSATFTPECRTTLRRLFADPSAPWTEVVSQRLRPELSYFAQVFFSPVARDAAVLECVWRLPRPAILYTTTRADARAWTARLRTEGFKRVACFDGDTPAGQRRELLQLWRDNALDLMVATSAFGMGVDKPDVRAVVHACLPEDLHRYYQEVGRSGRDGAAATCVLLPVFPRDREIAEGLAPRLLKPATLGRRWRALWDTHEATGEPHTWRIRTDARPPNLYGTDTGKRNITWNKRLLLQLARAQLIDLVDVQRASVDQRVTLPIPSLQPRVSAATRSPGDGGDADDWDDNGVDVAGLEFADVQEPEFATLCVHFAPRGREVEALIADMRDHELATLRYGFQQMLAYAQGEGCIGRLLQRMYGPDTVWTCSGCPDCRRRGRRFVCPPLPLPRAVRTQPTRLVIADVPSPASSIGERRRFEMLVRQLSAAGVHRFLCPTDGITAVRDAVARAYEGAARAIYRVDAWRPEEDPACASDEALAVLHMGVLEEGALRLAVGSRIVHLLTTGTPHLDADGRRPLERDGVPYYPNPKFWTPRPQHVY